MNKGDKMKKYLLTILGVLICVNVYAAWPSDSIRTKNWGSEILTDSDLEAQIDLLHTYLNDSLDETAGHKHDGTANEGIIIDLNDDAGVIGVKNVLDEANGGTGLSGFTSGDVIYASSSATLSLLGKGTANQVLQQGGSFPEWTGNLTLVTATSTTQFLNETTAPSTVASQGALYTKDTGGQPEIFFRSESSGTEIQLTTQGAMNESAIPTNIQVFTSSGTWTKPSSISTVYVKVWGGGGGGANPNGSNSTGAGGGGGYSEGLISVSGNVTVTVGSGGSAGVPGSAGGTSSFAGSSTIQGNGGGGGTAVSGSGSDGGAGGTASGGTINLTGISGQSALSGSQTIGPKGGTSPFGGEGGEGEGNSASLAGQVPGGGGGGGASSGGSAGAAGAKGMVIVYY